MVYRRLQRYQRDQHVILGSRGSVDIVEHVSSMDDKLANIRVAVEDLTMATRDHDVRIDSCLSRVGIVRFDAYQDLGGRQSTAVAFISRDFARMYVKLLKEGAADIPLAPEEQEALDQARGSKPFTIRPRAGAASSEDLSEDAVPSAPDEPVSLGIPGFRPRTEREVARENRRRSREGLPPIDEPPVPSVAGWSEPHTPAPKGEDGQSLAEQYVKERRGSRRGRKTAAEQTPAHADEDSGSNDGL
jgi:hypothetical protein